jgi:hypothetical protein
MMFTTEERRLISLYRSGTREDTAAQLREAIPYIDERDVRAAAESAIRKLMALGDTAFDEEYINRFTP